MEKKTMAEKKSKSTWPQHKMGQHCGYEEFEDGSIQPAPRYSQEFERLDREQAGIDHVLKTVTAHCVEMSKFIAGQRKHLWDEISKDYGIDLNSFGLSYHPGMNRLYKQPIPKQKTPDSAGDSNGS